jgi:putative alpha-1,2-mannosidase
MEFSKPFASYGFREFGKQDYKGFWRKFDQTKNFPEFAGKQIRAHFDFKTSANEKLKIKFAISPVSTAGAISNLRSEIPHWDFERTKREAQAAWNGELSKIAVTTIDRGEMTNFYTALYHALLTPTVYMDVDGNYKGLDQNVHNVRSSDFSRPTVNNGPAKAGTPNWTNYTTF